MYMYIYAYICIYIVDPAELLAFVRVDAE